MRSTIWTARGTAVLLIVAGWVATSHASLFVSTGQAGAQVQLDVAHTQYWTFGVSANVSDVDGALFAMKVGPRTASNITFSVIQGTYEDFGTAVPLFSKTLPASSFGQSWANVLFQDTAISLTAGNTYTGVLWSKAPDVQNVAYFIKGGSETPLTFVNETGAEVTPPGGGGITTPPIPEPASFVLLIVSGLALRRFKRKRLLSARARAPMESDL